MKYALVRILDEESCFLYDFCDVYIVHAKTYQRPGTVRGVYSVAIKSFCEFIGNVRLADIEIEKCEAWVASLKLKMKPHSLRTKVMAMRAVFNYGVKRGMINRNPLIDIKLPPPRFAGRILNDDELSGLIAAIEHPEARKACCFSLYTGLRAGELISLTWDQILTDRIIIPAEKAKSKRDRIIMLHPRAIDILGPVGNGRIFKLCIETLRRHLRLACDKIGVGRIRIHDMRHNWATRFLEQTEDYKAVMEAGGWATIASMRPYDHITRSRQKKIFRIKYSFKEPWRQPGP